MYICVYIEICPLQTLHCFLNYDYLKKKNFFLQWLFFLSLCYLYAVCSLLQVFCY